MKIKKVFNNNVALTENHKGEEIVVMGRGLTFQKKPGHDIDSEKIEKTFVTSSATFASNLSELLDEIPYEIMVLTKEIIDKANEQLGTILNESLYLTLSDHLHFAIKRTREGLPIGNALVWEVKRFYKEEYRVSLQVIDLIEEKLGVRLPEDETASITLHIFNARQDGAGMEETLAMTNIVHDVMNIVKYHFGIDFNEESMNYNRFITHIKYFAYRMLRGEFNDEDLDVLYEQIRKQYSDAYACAIKVQDYLQKQYERKMTKDELTYFIIHIHRVTSREKSK